MMGDEKKCGDAWLLLGGPDPSQLRLGDQAVTVPLRGGWCGWRGKQRGARSERGHNDVVEWKG